MAEVLFGLARGLVVVVIDPGLFYLPSVSRFHGILRDECYYPAFLAGFCFGLCQYSIQFFVAGSTVIGLCLRSLFQPVASVAD